MQDADYTAGQRPDGDPCPECGCTYSGDGPCATGPVVPSDEPAIERATQAAMTFDEDTPNPSHEWYRDMALAMFRAAGEDGSADA